MKKNLFVEWVIFLFQKVMGKTTQMPSEKEIIVPVIPAPGTPVKPAWKIEAEKLEN